MEYAREIARLLGELNSTQPGASIGGFRVDYDGDFEGNVVHVVWIVDEPVTGRLALSEADRLCQLASDQLGDRSKFVYCQFRNAAEHLEFRSLGESWLEPADHASASH